MDIIHVLILTQKNWVDLLLLMIGCLMNSKLDDLLWRPSKLHLSPHSTQHFHPAMHIVQHLDSV